MLYINDVSYPLKGFWDCGYHLIGTLGHVDPFNHQFKSLILTPEHYTHSLPTPPHCLSCPWVPLEGATGPRYFDDANAMYVPHITIFDYDETYE